MHRAAIKLRTDALGPLFVRMALMGIPCSLHFTPDNEYMVALVLDKFDPEIPEDAGLVVAAMIGHNDVHFIKTSDAELILVHKEDT